MRHPSAPATASKLRLAPSLCGLFVASTTLIDWYLNAPLQIQSLTEAEYYRYQDFLERPRQILAPPDFANQWWLVLAAAGAMYFLGFVAAKLVMTWHQSRCITNHSIYLKIIALAGLTMGFCAGILMFMGAYMLPIVWKIYLSLATTMLTSLGTFLVLRSPYHLYLWWKYKWLAAEVSQ